jgi:nucleoside-diphosphate-sugar epimerase
MTAVLVTGGSGFIGSAIVRGMSAAGHEVVAPYRPTDVPPRLAEIAAKVRLAPGVSITNGEGLDRLLEATRPSWVVHAAAAGVRPGTADAATMTDVNVGGTVRVLESAIRHGVSRMILLGSGFEYRPSEAPLGEDAPVGPTTIYGASKAAASVMATQYRDFEGAEVTVVRLFSVYGPRESPGRFVANAITKALEGAPIDMSSGAQVRDYLYVGDAAEAVIRLLSMAERPPAAVNVVGPERHSLREVAETVVELTGNRSVVRAGARAPNPGDRSTFLGNGDLLDRVLGWRPARGLRSGLSDTIDWYDRNRGTWNAH